jgi:hypothetical protein
MVGMYRLHGPTVIWDRDSIVWNQMLELVSLTFASWNQIGEWLRRLKHFDS